MDSETPDLDSLKLKPVKVEPRDWSLADDQKLVALIADHATRPKIAQALNRSVAAINRRAHKLGLCRSRDGRIAAENNVRKLQATLNPIPDVFQPHISKPTKPLTTEIDTPKRTKHSCGLLELGRTTCRWPCGKVGTPDFFYCGKPTHQKRVYCLAHCTKSYVNFKV